MSKEILIPITNGKGSKEIENGNYAVTCNVPGYDNSSIAPKNVEIKEGTNEYTFTISATGILTIKVSDTGDSTTGVPVENAIFYRTDSTGQEYGNPVTTDVDGNAKLEHLPFGTSTPQKIYIKQTSSDGSHTFESTVKEIDMDSENKEIEIINPEATSRNIILNDANYPNYPISDGDITFKN